MAAPPLSLERTDKEVRSDARSVGNTHNISESERCRNQGKTVQESEWQPKVRSDHTHARAQVLPALEEAGRSQV